MATFTLIEINNDHLADLIDGDEEDPKNYFAGVLQAISRNPEGNGQRMIDSCELHRVLRVICQNGDPIAESHASHHLWLNPSVKRRPINPDLMDIIADLEAFNTSQAMSGTLQEIIGRLRKAVR